ncbi:hypothetical protein SBOR_8496 [Sclerotinia borealis F-4128]|uniref:Uncharacterized protein n=1 Tax=Sclerotinia borealis (strain F-4128) TaxID=1432307 RepID=W9C2W2_SCLBF|nr:hypothetical protein SBOR_8496 [Sclerotinia borealis F-4128]
MSSMLARELRRQYSYFPPAITPRRICTHQHLHPVSAELCGDLLSDVKEIVTEAKNHQRYQEQRFDSVLAQTKLATDLLMNPRMRPSYDHNYHADNLFLQEFPWRYKQGVGLSTDEHREYIIDVSVVLKRAMLTLNQEYKGICPWSLMFKVDHTDLCPHLPICKHKQQYTPAQVPADHQRPPGGTTDAMGFCHDEFVVWPGKKVPDGCKLRIYCRLRHQEDCSQKEQWDASIIYVAACLHRDGLWD